jgi:autotransporter-associated beta strand protein
VDDKGPPTGDDDATFDDTGKDKNQVDLDGTAQTVTNLTISTDKGANNYEIADLAGGGSLTVKTKIAQTDNDAKISAKLSTDGDSLEISAANTLTISGELAGAGKITVTGGGTLELTTANTFTGDLAVSNGTVKIGDAKALGTTGGGTSVDAGAVLDLGGQAVGAEAVTINGTGIASGGALINSGSAASLSGVVTLGSDASIGGSGDITLYAGITETGNGLLRGIVDEVATGVTPVVNTIGASGAVAVIGGPGAGAIPEPATLALLGLGALASLVARRRRG